MVALPEHLELSLAVKPFNLGLVLGEFSAHGQLGHVSLVHVAELSDEISSLATAHDSRCIFNIVTQFEQSVRRLVSVAPQVVRVSALTVGAAMIAAMRVERMVDQRT